jgi:hypothetical protein
MISQTDSQRDDGPFPHGPLAHNKTPGCQTSGRRRPVEAKLHMLHAGKGPFSDKTGPRLYVVTPYCAGLGAGGHKRHHDAEH